MHKKTRVIQLKIFVYSQTFLKVLCFLIKNLIANFDIFFCAKNKYHTIYDLLKNELPSPQILIYFLNVPLSYVY